MSEKITSSSITTNTTTSLRRIPSGFHSIGVYGTWDGANADVHISGTGNSYGTVGTNGQFTANGWVAVKGPCEVRLVTTNVGGSTSLDVEYI